MSQPEEEPPAPWTARPRQAGAVRWDPVPLDDRFPVLALLLKTALVGASLAAGAWVLLSLWAVEQAKGALALEGTAWKDQYDGLAQQLTAVSVVLGLVTAALWLTWQYALARSASPGELTRSPVWHVTSWFLPVAFLWWPYQNVRDLWWRRAAGWGAATVGWWWSAVMAVLFVGTMIAAAQDNVESVGDFRDLQVLASVTSLAALIASLLALMIVGRLSETEPTVRTAP